VRNEVLLSQQLAPPGTSHTSDLPVKSMMRRCLTAVSAPAFVLLEPRALVSFSFSLSLTSGLRLLNPFHAWQFVHVDRYVHLVNNSIIKHMEGFKMKNEVSLRAYLPRCVNANATGSV